jgi:hypothetical protein
MNQAGTVPNRPTTRELDQLGEPRRCQDVAPTRLEGVTATTLNVSCTYHVPYVSIMIFERCLDTSQKRACRDKEGKKCKKSLPSKEEKKCKKRLSSKEGQKCKKSLPSKKGKKGQKCKKVFRNEVGSKSTKLCNIIQLRSKCSWLELLFPILAFKLFYCDAVLLHSPVAMPSY